MTIFNKVIPMDSQALFNILSFQNILLFTKVKWCQQHKIRSQPMKTDFTNRLYVFTSDFQKYLYCRKFLMSCNHSSHYIRKYIRMFIISSVRLGLLGINVLCWIMKAQNLDIRCAILEVCVSTILLYIFILSYEPCQANLCLRAFRHDKF